MYNIILKDTDFFKVDNALYPLPLGVFVYSEGYLHPVEIRCTDNKEFFDVVCDLLKEEGIKPIKLEN